MEQLHATADADALTARVAALIDAGRPAAARPLLAAVRRLAPPSPDLAELPRACALHRARARSQALQRTRRGDRRSARTCRPAQVPRRMRSSLGDLHGAVGGRRRSGDPRSARPCGEGAARHPDAGTGASGRSRRVPCARRSQPIRPTRSIAKASRPRRKRSAMPTRRWLRWPPASPRRPRAVELRNAAILLSVRRRDFATAYQLAEAARVAGVADACIVRPDGPCAVQPGAPRGSRGRLRRGAEARAR